jgi:hypothetical protein
MSYATFFLMTSFIAELLLSLYFLWTSSEVPKTNVRTPEGKFKALGSMAEGWRKSLLIFVVCFILFFIYYGALMVSMVDVTNVYDSTGTIRNTIENEDWRLGWEFLKIMIGLIMIDLGVLTWRIMNQTRIMVSIFGSTTNNSRKWH